ncbi:MAG: LodA/GoxA family CTQ-dependent oxidase [Pyrinomonadaceae bacterium]
MAGPVYRIHPAIGITRVGNANPDTFFIGPELPGRGPVGDPSVGTIVPSFKVAGELKPQAARFRIWEYVEKNGKLEPSREITLDDKDCIQIVWRVHVANRKASFFEFNYLQGEEPVPPPPPRRNASVTHRRKLEIDPLARQIGGRNKKGERYQFLKGKSSNPSSELWPDPAPSPVIEYLGELRTDPEGRLIVIGGKGKAGGLPGKALVDAFNNDGWFDDVSDGPVTAELTMRVKGKNKVYSPNDVEGAWVICGPPDFAPSLKNQVTLYDVLYDVAARQMTLPKKEVIFDTVLKPLVDLNAELLRGPKLSKYVPSFDEEILPIIMRAVETPFTFLPGTAAAPSTPTHSSFHPTLNQYAILGDPLAAGGAALRNMLFGRLHPPGVAGRPPVVGGLRPDMPLMHGDAFDQTAHMRFMLTLTDTQYAIMERWANGNFVKTAGTFPPALPAWMTTISPHGLDRAALENCVGGAFAVGIEVSWQIRNKKLYSAPFRINHKANSQYVGELNRIQPGHFTRQMALPWHTDFLGCRLTKQLAWWPAQRPDIVYLSSKDFDERYKPGKFHDWTRATTTWDAGRAKPTRKEFMENYYKLGVVREFPNGYHLEDDRNPSVP